MTQRIINIDRPESRQTRTEFTLGQIGAEWQYQPRGEAFTEALLDFLRSVGSSDTLRSYSFSILQFFDWYRRENNGRLVTPDRIRRADAIAFNTWLRERARGLQKWRLEQDPTRRLDLIIYEVVDDNPGIGFQDIADKAFRLTIRPGPNFSMARHLACLVKLRTLIRTPTIEELRRQAGHLIDPDPSEFSYFVPSVTTPEGAERASTVSTRLSALSSLWNYMIRMAENVPGRTEPLLQHNIWGEPLKRAQAQAPSHQAVSRAKKTPNLELFLRLLATTFYRTHGTRSDRSIAAARASFWGRPQVPPLKKIDTSFKDLRDRALMLLMAQTGARSKEVHRLTRESITSGESTILTLLGKRGKKRSIALPPAVIQALYEMDEKIELMAQHQSRYGGTGRAEKLRILSSPLLPAVSYWGANATQVEQGLTRPGIAQVLRRRAVASGISPKSPEFQKAHPHGMRHLFAKVAADSGTPLNRIQAMMGHASAATTGRYMEERTPDMLISEAFRVRTSTERVSKPLSGAESGLGVEPDWEPDVESIQAPMAPSPQPPVVRPSPVVPRVVQRVQTTEGFEGMPPTMAQQMGSPAAAPSPVAQAPRVMGPSPSAIASKADHEAQELARRRGTPLSTQDVKSVKKCRHITSDSLRKLCLIYELHWGEKGNRQQLLSTGGGKASVAARKRKLKAERVSELVETQDIFTENPEEMDDEALIAAMMAEEGIDPEDEDPEEEEEQSFEAMRAEAKQLKKEKSKILSSMATTTELHGETTTKKAHKIYSGKLSGLSWWIGSSGNLEPAMPVMSPDQVGQCSERKQDAICTQLVKLWRSWMAESPTKAEALVAWVGQALDVAAQMEVVVSQRGGKWIGSNDLWSLSHFAGTKRSQPLPREVFREHLPGEVVAWFQAAVHGEKDMQLAGQYRTSLGDPEVYEGTVISSKVLGEAPPSWYRLSDPVLDLPISDRVELLDWVLALTGKSPTSTIPQFRGVSRHKITKFIEAMCRFDGAIESIRTDKAYGPQFTSALLKRDRIQDFPKELQKSFLDAQEDARSALSMAGGVIDFDIFERVKKRVRQRRGVFGEPKKKETRIEQVAEGRIKAQPRRARVQDEEAEYEAEAEAEQSLAEMMEEAKALRSKKKFLKNAEPAKRILQSDWYLKIVKEMFGKEAASDKALRLVAKCGDVPLASYAEMFRIEGGTIRHTMQFKKSFANEYKTHSECVARRIARQLWEIRKTSPKSRNINRPNKIVTLVNVMQSYKVPCSPTQEDELRRLTTFTDDPLGIYQAWQRVHTEAGDEREGLSEVERHQRDLAEQHQDLVERAERIGVFGGGDYNRNPGCSIPTPVHLTVALML